MRLLALHAFDPVLGVDSHLVLVPTPAGPVPQMVPLIFVGWLVSWKMLRPANLATVKVNGMWQVHAGSPGMGRHVPRLGPFVKEPKNEAEVLLGSATVEVQGAPMGYGPLPVLTCHDFGGAAPSGSQRKRRTRWSSMLPTSVAIPIPYPAQVWIGGTSTISKQDAAKQAVPLVLRLTKLLRKVAKTTRLVRAARIAKKLEPLLDLAKDGSAIATFTPPER
ncbi:MAG: PAAR domain-containing protein [Polyangiales bacterium]